MDYAAPSGPPPPTVPEGWKAVWNEQYKTWFFVNIYTKSSQWDKPEHPVYPPAAHDDSAPPGPPPNYATRPGSSGPPVGDVKQNPYGGNSHNSQNNESDAAMAARLQAEENARAQHGTSPYGGQPQGTGNRNAMQDYMNTPMPPGASAGTATPYSAGGNTGGGQGNYGGGPGNYGGGQGGYGQSSPSHGEKSKGGLLGKFFGGGQRPSQQGQYPPQQPQQGYYGPPQGYGGGYGAPPPQQQRPHKAGMGAGAGAALGLGGGLLGGMMLEHALDDNHGGNTYIEENNYGGDDGGDYGGDDGGDFGGDGGGDF